MLRLALLGFACLLTLIGFACLFAGIKDASPMAIWGGVLLVVVLLERWRYRQSGEAISSEWQETDERFVDPETGRLTQVFYHPQTGQRRYVVVPDDAH